MFNQTISERHPGLQTSSMCLICSCVRGTDTTPCSFEQRTFVSSPQKDMNKLGYFCTNFGAPAPCRLEFLMSLPNGSYWIWVSLRSPKKVGVLLVSLQIRPKRGDPEKQTYPYAMVTTPYVHRLATLSRNPCDGCLKPQKGHDRGPCFEQPHSLTCQGARGRCSTDTSSWASQSPRCSRSWQNPRSKRGM